MFVGLVAAVGSFVGFVGCPVGRTLGLVDGIADGLIDAGDTTLTSWL